PPVEDDQRDEPHVPDRLRLPPGRAGLRRRLTTHQEREDAARQIAANESGSREAPPTRAPSTSGSARSSAALPGLTEPPYSTGRATVSSVSPKYCRRSEWPTMAPAAPTSSSIGAESSPV